MPKQSLNNSKITLKKSRKRLFLPQKWPKWTTQIGQNIKNLDLKSQILMSLMDFQSCLGSVWALFSVLNDQLLGVFTALKVLYMTPEIEILGQNFAHFDRFEGSFLTILGIEKVVFWTFSKLFWTCLGSFWALFSVLKGQLSFSLLPVTESLLWGPAKP